MPLNFNRNPQPPLEMKTYAHSLNAPGSQLWTLLNNQTPEGQLAAWGAKEIVPVKRSDDSIQRFMIKMSDGFWYYAHTMNGSCYVSTATGFLAKSGLQAWAMHEHDNGVQSLNYAEEKVANIRAELRLLESQINA